MADPYPASLPPLPTPLGFEPIDAGIISPNDSGLPSRRPIASKTGINVSWSQNMSGAQWTTIYTFWRDTLAMGSLPFELVDPLDDALKDWEFSGPPTTTLFRGDATSPGRGHRVTVNAKILP